MSCGNMCKTKIDDQAGTAIVEAAFVVGLLLFTLIALMNVLTLQEVRLAIQSSLLNSFNHIEMTSFQRDSRGELHPVHCETVYSPNTYDPSYICENALEFPPDELVRPMTILHRTITSNLFRGENTPFTDILNGEISGGCAFKLFYMELSDVSPLEGYGLGSLDQFEWLTPDTNNMQQTYTTSDLDISGLDTTTEWARLRDAITNKALSYAASSASTFVIGKRTTVMYEERESSIDDYFTWSPFIGFGCTIKTQSWGFFPMEITFTDVFVPNVNLRLKD